MGACKYLPSAVRLKYRCMEANFSDSDTDPATDDLPEFGSSDPKGFFDPNITPVPVGLMRVVKATGYLMWLYLAMHADRRTGEGGVVIEALAAGIDVHPRTVKIHLHKLAEAGHIMLGTPSKVLWLFSDGGQCWRPLIPYVVRAYAEWPHDEETLKWWEEQKLQNQKSEG